MSSGRGGKIVFGIGLGIFGLAVFMIASAYVVERELPKWLAATVGGLAFPVLPVVWHVIGERRRRTRLATAKTQPKNPLAPGDRYLLRAVTVAAAVLVPMFVVGRTAVLRATWNNKTWFIPDESYDSISGIEDMLAHVPSDAEAVLVIRDHEDKGKDMQAVMAYGDHQTVILAPVDKEDRADSKKALAEINKSRAKIPFVKIDELDLVKLGNHMAMVTAGWKSAIRSEGAGPRATLKAELAKAPASALVALAYAPAKPQLGIEKMNGWVLQKATNEKLTVEAEIATTDAAAAERVTDLVRALWKTQASEVPEKCRDEVDKLVDKVELERHGAKISFHLDVQPEQLLGLMMCGIQSADWKDKD